MLLKLYEHFSIFLPFYAFVFEVVLGISMFANNIIFLTINWFAESGIQISTNTGF